MRDFFEWIDGEAPAWVVVFAIVMTLVGLVFVAALLAVITLYCSWVFALVAAGASFTTWREWKKHKDGHND